MSKDVESPPPEGRTLWDVFAEADLTESTQDLEPSQPTTAE